LQPLSSRRTEYRAPCLSHLRTEDRRHQPPDGGYSARRGDGARRNRLSRAAATRTGKPTPARAGKLDGVMAPRSLPNYLAGPYVQRLAPLRKDEARLRAAMADPQTLFVPVWRSHSLIVHTATSFAAGFTPMAQLGHLDLSQLTLLGEFRGQLAFAVEL